MILRRDNPMVIDKPHPMTVVLSESLYQALLLRAKLESRKPSAMARRILEEVLMVKEVGQ